MGIQSSTLTASAVNNRVATSYPIEKGTLVAASAEISDLAILSSRIWARISIAIDGTAPENIVATLAQGNIGSGVSLPWTGAIKCQPNYKLLLETWGRSATTVKLKSITE